MASAHFSSALEQTYPYFKEFRLLLVKTHQTPGHYFLFLALEPSRHEAYVISTWFQVWSTVIRDLR